MPGKRMGPPPRSFAADAHECIMVRVLDPPNTRSWRDDPRPESGLPSDRHPDRTKRAVVLEAVKVWPGKTSVCCKGGVTAKLDSSCARRLCNILRVGAKKPGSRPNKETEQERCALSNRLTKNAPSRWACSWPE